MVVSELPENALCVLIVDAHRLIRAGLSRLLTEKFNINMVVEAENGEKAIHAVKRKRPDLIVIEFSLPGISGAEVSRKLLAYDDSLKIILLTNPTIYHSTKKLLTSGIKGFVTKNESISELHAAVRSVLEGEAYIASSIATEMAFAVMNSQNDSPFDSLSARELEIVMLILDGKKNLQIADALYISDKTVSTYRARAMSKLQVDSATKLTLLAMRYGLITLA